MLPTRSRVRDVGAPSIDSLWFSKSKICRLYMEKDCQKLYATEFFFLWKILMI